MELEIVPLKLESVLTCSVYVSPAGEEAVHEAVRLVVVAVVIERFVGVAAVTVTLLPRFTKLVDSPLWFTVLTCA